LLIVVTSENSFSLASPKTRLNRRSEKVQTAVLKDGLNSIK